jgi:hypothetical protein
MSNATLAKKFAGTQTDALFAVEETAPAAAAAPAVEPQRWFISPITKEVVYIDFC